MSGSRKIIGNTERAHVIVRLVRSICDEDFAIVRFAGFMPHAGINGTNPTDPASLVCTQFEATEGEEAAFHYYAQ